METDRKTDWFGVAVPLLISFGLAILIINNDSPRVLVLAWMSVGGAVVWAIVKLLQRLRWVWWKKTIPAGITLVFIAYFGYQNIRERLRPSFVFVTPGVLLNEDTWDFIVNHRGSKTSYNPQILFVDEDRLEYLRRTTKALTPEDFKSYQLLLSLPEMNPKGRGTVFAKQFQWKPFSLTNSHFTAEITWRDGSAREEMRIAKVKKDWKYSIVVRNKETGKFLYRCQDENFPSTDANLPSCLPDIVATD